MTSKKETIQIFLNSKTADKYIGGYTSNCIFNLPMILIPKAKHLQVSVQSATIPNSWYNVDYYNNKFEYKVNNGATISLIIPQGNYNVNTLRTFLQANMPNFTITYNILDNTYTFQHSTYDFQFLSSSTCMEILGFDEHDIYISATRILKSVNAINLFTIRNIYIQSSNMMLNNINHATPNNCCVLSSIPVSSGSNGIINYSNINDVKSSINSIRNFSILNVYLTDQDGDILDLNGCHFSLTLQIDYEF
jgi:hypothetical protein